MKWLEDEDHFFPADLFKNRTEEKPHDEHAQDVYAGGKSLYGACRGSSLLDDYCSCSFGKVVGYTLEVQYDVRIIRSEMSGSADCSYFIYLSIPEAFAFKDKISFFLNDVQGSCLIIGIEAFLAQFKQLG